MAGAPLHNPHSRTLAMAGTTKALRQVNGAGAPRLIQDTAAVTVEGEVTVRVRDTAPDQDTEAEAEGTIMVLRRITVVSSVVVADIVQATSWEISAVSHRVEDTVMGTGMVMVEIHSWAIWATWEV